MAITARCEWSPICMRGVAGVEEDGGGVDGPPGAGGPPDGAPVPVPDREIIRCIKRFLAREIYQRIRAEARAAVASYIDRYNPTRRHRACEMKSPIDYETILATRATEPSPTGRRRETGLQNRLTGSQRARLAPDTGPMTGSISNRQPATIRGEAHSATVGSSA
jgi:hypothetical protein